MRQCSQCDNIGDVCFMGRYDSAAWFVFACYQHRQVIDRRLRTIRFAGHLPSNVSEHYANSELIARVFSLGDSP
jgi:hypothetical protein